MDVLYFVEINLLCIVILLILKNRTSDKSEKFSTINIAFNFIIVASIIFCASDMIGVICNGKDFFGVRAIIEICNLIYIESLTIISYVWMLYVCFRLKQSENFSNARKLAFTIPLIIFTIIVLTNPITHLLFTLDANNVYVRSKWIFLHWIINWSYFLIPVFVLLHEIIIDKNKTRYKEILPLLSFIVAPAIGSIVQMFVPGLPSSQAGVTISLVIVGLSTQSRQIFKDSLTGLNNHRKFDDFINEHILHHADERLTLMMIDVDKFKTVNDKFGHIVGDFVLKETADALSIAAKKSDSKIFLFRYGGDEFVAAAENALRENMLAFCDAAHYEVNNIAFEQDKNFSIDLSIGVSSGLCASLEDAESLLRVSDENMYEEKRRKNLSVSSPKKKFFG